MSKKKDIAAEQPQENYEAVFIKRESHLGYRAYSMTVTNGKAEIKPLHNSPDLPAIALGVAQDYLKDTL